MIMARHDRLPAAGGSCSLVMAVALLVCAAGVDSAAGQAGGMPQPARKQRRGPRRRGRRRARGRAGEGRGRAVRDAEGAPAKKEEAAAQVGLTETAQRAVSDAEHALLFAGFAAPPALAGWPRRPASLSRAEMRRIAGMRRGFANGLAAKPAPLASLATNYRAKHRQLHPLPTTPSCHVLMPHPSNGLLFFEHPSKVSKCGSSPPPQPLIMCTDKRQRKIVGSYVHIEKRS